MCCLFGILDYGNALSGKVKARMLSILAKECEVRGADATGIAYVSHNRLRIYKRPLPAHRMHFFLPGDVKAVMGHTRLTTQGSEKRNYNNHPFPSRCGNMTFALAHNGVLYNDLALRRDRKLPRTNIETDSYIAVQLLQEKGTLNMLTLKETAELLEGSFTITVLDQDNSMYFIKGDNPLCIYYYPRINLYLYASTAEIMERAVARMGLPLKHHRQLELTCGDILRLSPDGRIENMKFDTTKLDARYYYSLWTPSPYCRPYHSALLSSEEDDYLTELKSVACSFGYTPGDIDALLADGFAPDEIEEMLYSGEL